MRRPKDVGSTVEVVDNILILDENNLAVYCGKGIRGLLCSLDSPDDRQVLNHLKDPVDQRELADGIAQVRETRIPVCVPMKTLEQSIYVFPTADRDSQTIVLSTEEEAIRAQSVRHALAERVKELECLYQISSEMKSSQDLDTAFNKSIKHLTEGFQYPDITSVRIELKQKKAYGDLEATPENTAGSLTEEIYLDSKSVGRIIVFYHKPAEFLLEERKLLKEIATLIAVRLERQKQTRRLEQQQKVLLAKNQKLMELTEECGEARKKLQAVLDAITDRLIVIDSDFHVIRANSDDIQPGARCHMELFDCDHVCVDCPAQLAFENREPATVEKRVNDRHYVLRAYPILNDEGTVDRVVETCSDVTMQKNMEAQLFQSYKLASIGKLVAGIAHEINNPNTFIRGNVKIIQEAFTDIFPILDDAAGKNPEMKIARLNYQVFREHIPQLIEDMDHGTDRINKIVLGLRNFAKKDDGLPTDDVDLNDLIRNDLRITQKEIKKVARVQVNLDKSLPRFKGNRQKLEQVLMNLLLNAAQAINHENGLITVETRYKKDAREVILKVVDNGAGMDEQTRKHIFDPFFTTKRSRGGTGLGLSITYGIIKDHNGQIQVESSPGTGTTFTIHLPTGQQEKA